MSASLGARIAGSQLNPSAPLVVAAAAVAVVLVVADGPWQRARSLITVAHEAGHALTARATGRRLVRVRPHAETAGLAVTSGRPDGPGMVTTLLAGYVTPSLLGLFGVLLLTDGLVTIALWVAVVLLLAALALVRDAHGVAVILGAGAAVGLLAWFAPATVQAALGLAGTWFLLIGAVRPVLELHRQHRAGEAWNSDAHQLARLTRLPAQLWIALLGGLTAAALPLAAWLILH
jgi:hypothetical protein